VSKEGVLPVFSDSESKTEKKKKNIYFSTAVSLHITVMDILK